MHYGEPVIRKAVPLALGLLCASNPLVNVLDTLSKYSHDNDNDVALSAIFAMGLVGAGTNNARLAQMLRQLASYYHKDASSLFMVRIAQGLLHMAKGTMTLNPFHTDRQIMSPVAVAGLMCSLITMTDTKSCKLLPETASSVWLDTNELNAQLSLESSIISFIPLSQPCIHDSSSHSTKS